MRNWAYIFVFFIFSAGAFAYEWGLETCGPGGCGAKVADLGLHGYSHPGPDLGGKMGDAKDLSNKSANAAYDDMERILRNIKKLDDRSAALDLEQKANDAKRTPETEAAWKKKDDEIKAEREAIKNRRESEMNDLKRQAGQSGAGKSASAGNSAGQNQAKSGGMPFMPPPPGGGKGDEGGGDKGGEQLQAAKVPTPAPQATPPALAAKSTEIISDGEFEKMMQAAKTSKVGEGTSATSREIAALQAETTALQQQVKEAQAANAAIRADESLKEMQRTPTARTGTMLTSTGNTGSTNSSGSPFDLSPKNTSGAPTMNAVQTASTKKPTTGTANTSGATMAAVQVSSSKQQASSRLLASATGNVSESSELTVTSSGGSGAVRSGVVTKPKTSGPVYGMRSSSTRVGVYSKMTVPKALQTTMNQRIAVVGGSTPQNHQPPQVAAAPAKPSYYTDGATSRMRSATQPVSAHLGR